MAGIQAALRVKSTLLSALEGYAEAQGIGYQTLINAALRKAMQSAKGAPLTVASLRTVLRQELAAIGNQSA
ncbi:hypothetical protein [Duganella sp. Leaf126]|uniref:hypothetical protein n=1 Tax=Duganella sp. Leaf126 TaxID=1736266 RepID=UPI0012E28049|nr:hypothetical protein [Duganella sp. Leaf126]